MRSGERYGLTGTPGIFVNGRQHLKDYEPKTPVAALTVLTQASWSFTFGHENLREREPGAGGSRQ